MGKLARWLRDQPGREAEAEALYREAVAAGSAHALLELVGWLSELPGREADDEAEFRWAAACGSPTARIELLTLLQIDRAAEAQQIRRFGLDADGGTTEPT